MRRSVLAATVAFGLSLGVFGPATAASTDRDSLADEAIGLMIEHSGSGQAEALLGILYLRGMRIETDPVAASAWLDRAAAAGHPAGVYAAARMYAEGIGVPADPERARRLLRDADPAAYGPLGEAVRQLRLSLDLPDSPPGREIPTPVTAPPAPVLPAAPVPLPAPVVQAEPPAVEPAPTTAPAPAPVQQSAAPEPPAVEPPPAVAAPVAVAPPAPAPAQAPAPAPVPAAPTASAPPAAAVGSETPSAPHVQLATLFTDASTASELERIRTRMPPDAMAGRDLVVQTVRLSDGRTAWRILAVGFATRDDVKAFCGQATARGLGCIPRG